MLNNKILLITGGTGTFGNAVLQKFIKTNIKEIRIFSRDEKKQDDMRKKYSSNKLKFYIGDVRDSESIRQPMKNVNFVFHAAALKQVPSCEFHPLEAVKTNILGTENILQSAIENKVKKVICLSTDKAVSPINAMGISKAMMEKIAIANSLKSNSTIICITRYGNVMASRGSVIPLFVKSIIEKKPITITNSDMTRFMMTLEEAVQLVFFALKNAKNGEIFVQKSPAVTIKNLSSALIKIFKSKSDVKNIGIRHGEKLYETLLTSEEMSKAYDLGKFYKIPPDFRDLIYENYVEKGINKSKNSFSEYNSNNTKLLSINEIEKLLLKIPFIKSILNNNFDESVF